jgi:hypothetical protein
LEIAAGEHCYATPHSSGAAPQHNSEQREALADSISHKLHPMVEQYAQLFKTGIRTPVLKRPSDIGLDYEDVFFRRWTASRWRPSSFQLIRTSC